MTSISTRASRGSRAAWMVDRAGAGDANIVAYTSFIAAKSFMSARYTVVFTTCSKPTPAAASTCCRLAKTCRVCAAISPSTSCPVCGSSGIWPEQNTHPSTIDGLRVRPDRLRRLVRRHTPRAWDGYAALTTLFERRQRVQTRSLRTPPFTSARTVCRLGSNRRGRTLWAWLMVRPTTGPLSQISQRFAMRSFLGILRRVYGRRPAAVTGRKRRIIAGLLSPAEGSARHGSCGWRRLGPARTRWLAPSRARARTTLEIGGTPGAGQSPPPPGRRVRSREARAGPHARECARRPHARARSVAARSSGPKPLGRQRLRLVLVNDATSARFVGRRQRRRGISDIGVDDRAERIRRLGADDAEQRKNSCCWRSVRPRTVGTMMATSCSRWRCSTAAGCARADCR